MALSMRNVQRLAGTRKGERVINSLETLPVADSSAAQMIKNRLITLLL